MTRFELIGAIDDQHRLSLIVPDQIKAGAVKVILEVPDEEQDDWAEGIAHIWARLE